MANDQLEFLQTRFRRDVDDIKLDPQSDAGLLFTDDDVLEYINVANQEFVEATKARPEMLRLSIQPNVRTITVPDRVIASRYMWATLESTGKRIPEVNLNESSYEYDYDTLIETSVFDSDQTGPPKMFTFDYEEGKLYLSHIPTTADRLLLPVYLEAKEICSWNDSLGIKKMRYVRMLLAGMKREAYLKQDADVYDKQESDRWRDIFAGYITQVMGELERRNKKPACMPYGGL